MSNTQNESLNEKTTYWKTLKEFYNDPTALEAKANEFMEGVTDDFKLSDLTKVSRRKFLALLSTSAAFAAAGCADYHDKNEVIPYNNRPEEILPGIANYYASTCTGCEKACGILVKTREGRPIKIDGNPDHPINQGVICNVGQASILNLYDPTRLNKPLKRSGGRYIEQSWLSVDKEIVNALKESNNSGKEIAIITPPVNSPSFSKLLNEFQSKFINTKVYSYSFFNNPSILNTNNGSAKNISLDKAKIIVSFDSDFLQTDGNSIENIRMFAKGKDVQNLKDFNRLYVIEGGFSLTGMNADYRIRLRPDAQLMLIKAVKNAISGNSTELNNITVKFGLNKKYLDQLIKDIKSHPDKTVFLAGNHLPKEVHDEIKTLNNDDNYSDSDNINYHQYASYKDFEDLTTKINNDQVAVIINFDTNPVYHLPKDLNFEESFKNAPLTISLSEYESETSVNSIYQLPINHMLESWGDFNSRKGIYSLQQPVISPLFNTRQKEAVLLNWLNDDPSNYKENIYHQYVMNNWLNGNYNSSTSLAPNTFWYAALESGAVKTDQKDIPVVVPKNVINKNSKTLEVSDDFVVQLRESYSIGDGKYANNGFLQELPNPISKIVWDNYASISPDTAKFLEVDTNDLIEINIDDRKQNFPVFIQPGMADKVILIETGYGREFAGEVATGVGVNANILMSKDYSITPFLYNNAKAKKINGSHKLVSTVEHHSLDDDFLKDIHKERHIIREGNLINYDPDDPDYLHAGEREHKSLHKLAEFTKDGVKWGMGIDLNKCIGCNYCITSCNVENNIPVVGKDQVDRGREMHWLRIDRYYSGTPNEPQISNQPMLCQHCDTAPCENVCPVVATTHSEDGLNQMAYNRCVGTRYCSNNCPYKVRRFNFYDFRDNFEDGYYYQEPFNYVSNPEVTVRSRGVMEKCTFCIQRIMQARENAIEEGRTLKGSDVVTACQSACPSQAIVFGDTNDPESSVSKFRDHNLAYYVLDEINTRPNVTYLAKLRNTSEGNSEH